MVLNLQQLVQTKKIKILQIRMKSQTIINLKCLHEISGLLNLVKIQIKVKESKSQKILMRLDQLFKIVLLVAVVLV
jgi:hypothetical protein